MESLDQKFIEEIERMAGKPETPETPEVPEIEPEVQETPETPEKPEIPETPEVPETPETVVPEGYINFSDVFKDYSSPDDVLTRLKTSTEELNAYKEKLANVEKKFEFTDRLLPGETEELYKLRMIKKEKPEKFDLAKQLIFGNPDPMQLIRLELRNSVPGLQDVPDSDIDIYLGDKYVLDMEGVDMDDEDAVAQRQKQIAKSKVALKIDSEKAKNTLLSEFNVEVPEMKSEEEILKERQQSQKELVDKWSPAFAGLKDKLNKVSVPVHGKDGSDTFLEIEIPSDKRAGYINQLAEHVINSGMEYNDQNKGFLETFVINRFLLDNWANINAEIIRKARDMEEADWMKMKFNVKSPENKDQRKAPPQPVTTESEFNKALKDMK